MATRERSRMALRSRAVEAKRLMAVMMRRIGRGRRVRASFWPALCSTPLSLVRSPTSLSGETRPHTRTEILVDVVDVVLQGSAIPEKFLGITLFALVPNTTEFMNAISFAINGNIALRCVGGLGVSSAKLTGSQHGDRVRLCYPCVQRPTIASHASLTPRTEVCLLQIPAMVAFTAWYSIGKESMAHRAFTCVCSHALIEVLPDDRTASCSLAGMSSPSSSRCSSSPTLIVRPHSLR